MATNDGYSPYPIGLTAAQSVQALKRAYNLNTELDGYVEVFETTVAPTINSDDVKTGDIWKNTGTGKVFMANVESSVLVWLEV